MTTIESRYGMYEAVLARFGADDNDRPPEPGEELPRYCLVERDPHDNKWCDFADTSEELLLAMESDDSDYLPQALVDLDSGEVRLVRIRYDVTGSPVAETLDRVGGARRKGG